MTDEVCGAPIQECWEDEVTEETVLIALEALSEEMTIRHDMPVSKELLCDELDEISIRCVAAREDRLGRYITWPGLDIQIGRGKNQPYTMVVLVHELTHWIQDRFYGDGIEHTQPWYSVPYTCVSCEEDAAISDCASMRALKKLDGR
jgi:hypothetical protein